MSRLVRCVGALLIVSACGRRDVTAAPSAAASTSTPRLDAQAARAVGTLVFLPSAFGHDQGAWSPPQGDAAPPTSDAVDRGIATEVEVLKSASLATRVVERAGATSLVAERRALEGDLRAAVVTRRGASLVLEVSVAHADQWRAKTVCHWLLTSYIDQRRDLRMREAAARVESLDKQLFQARGAAPKSATVEQLEREAREAFLEMQRLEAWSDVRVLDDCASDAPPSR